MPANIEIKARASDFEAQARLAAALADGPCQVLDQTDTFFEVAQGRLKLREFGDGSGELIQYQRADETGPKTSSYVISRTGEPDTLRSALAAALGVRSVVRKQRRVWLTGNTRMHFDRVEGLGEYIELEVVLDEELDADAGHEVAGELMERLGISAVDLVSGAYVDLLQRQG